MPDFKTRLARIKKNTSSDSVEDGSALTKKNAENTASAERESEACETAKHQTDFKKKLERIKARRTNADHVRHDESGSKPDAAENDAEETDECDETERVSLRQKPGNTEPVLPHELPSWERVGEYLETRTLLVPLEAGSAKLSKNWPVLVPQCRAYLESHGEIAKAALLFFDLETTGLSGGAGTLAFLAAFGSFEGDCLQVRQYLLLDYAGEEELLKAVEAELYDESPGTEKASDSQVVLVTYNGRAYDTQILRNRFLLAGKRRDLDFTHLDLLYPARILWKHRLKSCSQKDIERDVLGMDRGFDLPGSEAPYAWFSFLRTGSRERLEMIADHNARDIHGLASLFLAMDRIAENPADAGLAYRCNLRNLGLRWRHDRTEQRLLLGKAANLQTPEALLDVAAGCMEDGDNKGADAALEMLATHPEVSSMQKFEACRKLAIYAEWKLKDYPRALLWTDTALELEFLTREARADLRKRKKRLEARFASK